MVPGRPGRPRKDQWDMYPENIQIGYREVLEKAFKEKQDKMFEKEYETKRNLEKFIQENSDLVEFLESRKEDNSYLFLSII